MKTKLFALLLALTIIAPFMEACLEDGYNEDTLYTGSDETDGDKLTDIITTETIETDSKTEVVTTEYQNTEIIPSPEENNTTAFEDETIAPPEDETTFPKEETTVPKEEITDPIESSFSIHFIDVGQADAALIECDGEYMLIDGGNKADSNVIYTVLKESGVKHLRIVVGTHAHEDHIGGLPGAFNYATADMTLCPVESFDTDAFNDFAKYANKNGGGITIPSAGDIYKLGSATVKILGVNGGSDVNDTSIVLKITYGKTTFLFTGDAERKAEQTILQSDADLSATVLKVGHHGSDTSTSYVFLREIMPQYAVISVGEDNSYGHPTEATLSLLRDADVKTFRTDLQGDIYCISDGETVSFSVERNEDADTLAPVVTVERLQEIIKQACNKYDTQTIKKLNGELTYSVISTTEVKLTYDITPLITADTLYLVDEVMDQVLSVVIAYINESSFPEEVTVHITADYDIEEDTSPEIPPTPDTEPGTDYVGNKNTKKFHYSWCGSVDAMKESNKYYYTGTRDEMIAKGYVPCKKCNP